MTTTVRTTYQSVTVNGELTPLTKVLASSAPWGFTQAYGTAQVSLAYPLPASIHAFSTITIDMSAGSTDPDDARRFTGYVLEPQTGLWPGSVTLACGDPLVLADYYYPATKKRLHGMTDQQIIRLVLNTVGIPIDAVVGIGGTGKIVGKKKSAALTWMPNESGLDVIKKIDAVSVKKRMDNTYIAYRTYCNADGVVRREAIETFPSGTPDLTFTEGVDVLEGTATFALVNPKDSITVVGDGAKSSSSGSGWKQSAYWKRYRVLQIIAEDILQLSTDEVNSYIFGQLAQDVVRVEFSTQRDDRLDGQFIVQLEIPHLGVSGPFWLQAATPDIAAESGAFTQRLSCVSRLSLLAPGAGTPGTTGPGTGATPPTPYVPPGGPETPVSIVVPTIAIVGIDVEVGIVADTPTTLDICAFTGEATSNLGTIVSMTWTAAGPGVLVTTGSGDHFETAFSDLTGATVTLDATDSLGGTGTVTLALDGGAGATATSTKLYAAEGDRMAVWNGSAWSSQPPSAGSVVLIGNGWIAATGDAPTPIVCTPIVPPTFTPTGPALWIGTGEGLRIWDSGELKYAVFPNTNQITQIDSPVGFPGELIVYDSFNDDGQVLWRTVDFGVTWEQVAPPSGGFFTYDPNFQMLDTGKFIVEVFHTSTAGENGPRVWTSGSWAARIVPLYRNGWQRAGVYVGPSKMWTWGEISGTFVGTVIFPKNGDVHYLHSYDLDGSSIAHVSGVPSYGTTGELPDIQWSFEASPDVDNRVYAYEVRNQTPSQRGIRRIDGTSATDVSTPDAGDASYVQTKLVWAPVGDLVFAVTAHGDPDFGNRLWRSTNAGGSWTEITIDLLFPNYMSNGGARQSVFTVNPAVADEFYFLNGNQILKSTDAGVTWAVLYSGSVGLYSVKYTS